MQNSPPPLEGLVRFAARALQGEGENVHRMTSRLLQRVLHLIPVLLGTTLVVFAMIAATPGDPVQIMLGDQRATPEQVAALRHDMGLDLPLAERFVALRLARAAR